MDERLGDEELVWLLSDTFGDIDGVTEADIDPEKEAAACKFSKDAAVLWIDSPDTSDIFSVVLSLKNLLNFIFLAQKTGKFMSEKGSFSAWDVC